MKTTLFVDMAPLLNVWSSSRRGGLWWNSWDHGANETGGARLTERMQCEFVIVRYVPAIVRGEFVNVGVILRASPSASANPETLLRFASNWDRVLCLDRDADLRLFEQLEDDLISRFRLEHATAAKGITLKPFLETVFESFSNSIQVSDLQASLAEDLETELNRLMKMYVEPPRIATAPVARSDRELISAEIRQQFSHGSVWHLMRKQIRTSVYTRPGDPMKIDCGYRYGDVVRLFHAVSLRSSSKPAKSLAYSASDIIAGIKRIEGATVELAAVVEPLRRIAVRDAEQEAGERYRYCMEIMEREGIRVFTTNALAGPVRTAQLELTT